MLQRIMSKLGYSKTGKRSSGFYAASAGRLTASWTASNLSANGLLRNQLRIIRARSRDLSINNPYIKKFADMVCTNTLGHSGISYQSKIQLSDGNFDEKNNKIIESAWSQWGERLSSPDVTGLLSWVGLQRLVLRAVVVDGEILIRKIRGYNNKGLFALQIIEADHLDELYNTDLRDGGKVRLGIEYDPWGKPVAYHLWKKHPGDYQPSTAAYGQRERVPAEEIIHLYVPVRIGQGRGIPWAYSVMVKTNILDGYEESELVAARVAAAQMGIFTSNNNNGMYPAPEGTDENSDQYMNAEPGTFRKAPEGTTLTMFDPKHPAGNYDPFVKMVLRSIAVGCGVSYHSLANDLESVNFSSIRSGTLEERDMWRAIQSWFIDDLCKMVQPDWLKMQLLTQALPYSIQNFEKVNQPKWQGRSWAWVDPLKDQKANAEGLAMGIITYSDVAAERGKDFYEIIDQRAHEEQYIKGKGLSFPVQKKPAQPLNEKQPSGEGG